MTVGFVFPGQGSQEVGMLGDFFAEPVVSQCFAEADDVLGIRLGDIVRNGPESELNQTATTQPALLTASVALWRLWLARGGATPVCVTGHSLGEYAALVAAGALAFRDAVGLVRTRGLLMQDAVPAGQGAMAAILGLEDDVVEGCCAAVVAGVVSAANYNAPGQVVIAGDAAAVDAAIERCKTAGAKRAMRLAVSVPSHCALMRPAAERFESTLRGIKWNSPTIPVIHNVDAGNSATADTLREKLLAQLYRPVRWTSCVARMAELGVDTVVECGPGRVLGALVKRIDKNIRVFGLSTTAGFAEALGPGSR